MSDDVDETGEDAGAEAASGRAPLADLAATVDERRHDRASESDELADGFTVEEVSELDREELWADLRGEAEGRDASESPPSADAASDRAVRTIRKRTCHGCQFFGEPPDLHCTHDGTAIVEMVDTEQFRVADCPMVDDDESVQVDGAE